MAANDIQSLLNCSNELLSSSDLFQRRSQSHKIPVRGQKEFFLNDSAQQKACLQKTLDEHWMLVKEERVERVGNLVNAEWIPEEKVVKLKTSAGKFWHTMGFSDEGQQYLFPEEALYLMECGNVQVLFRDLPLSIQEGYESFLSAETVTFLQYQVFSHLKRLGYVVTRFDNRMYSKKSAASPEVSAGQHEGNIKTSVPYSNLESPGQLQTQQAFQHKTLELEPESDRAPGRNWWINQSQPTPVSIQPSARHWDFSCIFFPDVGSYSDNRTCLPPPDPTLLPGALHVPECHMAYWRSIINSKEEHRSQQTQQRVQNRHTCNIYDDRGKSRCRNGVKHLTKQRMSQQQNIRLTYLGNQDVMPLTQPGKCSSHSELLEQVNLIQSDDLLVENSRFPSSDQWRITFNVYQPDTEFKKSHPGKPCTRLCICSFDGPVPNLHVLKQLSIESGDVPVTFAVVDHGDISFYCFKEFKLPTDTY